MERTKGEIIKKPRFSREVRERILTITIWVIVIALALGCTYLSLWLEYKKINFLTWMFG